MATCTDQPSAPTFFPSSFWPSFLFTEMPLTHPEFYYTALPWGIKMSRTPSTNGENTFHMLAAKQRVSL